MILTRPNITTNYDLLQNPMPQKKTTLTQTLSYHKTQVKVCDTVLLDQCKQTMAQLTVQENHMLEVDKRLAKAHIR